MDRNELMFELSHQHRVGILEKIQKKPLRLSAISKSLGVTTAEIARHLERLSKAGLVAKGSDSHYYLTSYASMVMHELERFEYLVKNKDFFEAHDMSFIPSELLWLSFMSCGEFSKGILANMGEVMESSVTADEFLYVISPELFQTVTEIDCQKVDDGLDVKKIYPEDLELAPEYKARLGNDNLHIRTLPIVKFSMKISEKIAGVAFPTSNGKIDYETTIMGKDPRFLKWSHILFEHYWDIARPVLR